MKDIEDESDEGFVEKAYARLKECREHQAEWREEAREDFDFVAGEQWAEEDKQLLRDQLRPCITFNRVGPVMDTIGGLEITNRQETRYIPRETNDRAVSEVLSAAAKYFRDQADAEDEESEAFMNSAICGLGWTETYLDYDYSPEGKICIENRDPFEMYYDPLSQKANLSDARYLFRVKALTEEEFYATFPDAPEDVGTGPAFDPADIGIMRDNPRDQYKVGDEKSKTGLYWVIEYQWKELVPQTIIASGSASAEMPADRIEKIKEAVPSAKTAERKETRYMRAFLCGNSILKKGDGPCKHGFTYKAITAKRDRNRGTWYGIVKAMKDPQRWANKWLSQALHILNSNAKGGAFIERSALQNPRKAEETWADPAALIILNDGGTQKIRDRQIGNFPAGFDKLMSFAVQSMRDVTGINQELMGLTERDQAGIVENARKQSGYTIVARLFNALRRYRKEQGRLLMYFIQEYIPDGTLIRIGEASQAQYVPLIKNPAVLEYDVVVDDAPFSPNQKEAVWASLQQLFPVIAKMNVPPEMWALLMKYSPLPETATSKMEAIIQQAASQPSPEQQARDHEMQIQQMQAQQEAQARQAEMQMKAADIQGKMQADQQKAQLDIQVKQMDAQIKMLELEMKKIEAHMKGAELHMNQMALEAETAVKMKEVEIKDKEADLRAS